jgi:hypothetical protein
MRFNPDNAPAKKEAYKASLMTLADENLYEECRSKIWLSAYASNNPNSCYHWQCDYCYDESSRRGKIEEIYSKAHRDEMKANGY